MSDRHNSARQMHNVHGAPQEQISVGTLKAARHPADIRFISIILFDRSVG